MSKEELLNLKEELKKEILNEIETTKNLGEWRLYVNSEINPRLEKILAPREKYQMSTALNTIARIYNQKKHVRAISKEEVNDIRDVMEFIVSGLESRKK